VLRFQRSHRIAAHAAANFKNPDSWMPENPIKQLLKIMEKVSHREGNPGRGH
jgi:hypothetical protein